MVKKILLVFFSSCLLFTKMGTASDGKKTWTVENLMAAKSLYIRTTLTPEEVYVGQLSTYSIELITDSWFSGGVEVSELWISDAIVIQLGPPENNYQYIEGKQCSAFRIHFGIFPQRTGEIKIPSLRMKTTTFPDGRQNPVKIVLDIQPQVLVAQVPETGQKIQNQISTSELTVTEQFNRSFEGLKVGESLQRSIRIDGKNLVAMMLPPIQSGVISGIGIYPGKPKLFNNFETEGVDGVRMDTITYIMEKAGSYQLPEIRIHWWNTEDEEMQETLIESIQFKVAENPFLSSLHAGTSPGDGSKPKKEVEKEETSLQFSSIGVLVISLMFSGLILLLLVRKARGRRSVLATGKAEKQFTDAMLKKQLRQACLANDEPAIVNSLMCWLDRHTPADRAALLRNHIAGLENDELKKQVDVLMKTLYGKTNGKFESGSILFQNFNRSLKKDGIFGQSRWKGRTGNEHKWTLNP